MSETKKKTGDLLQRLRQFRGSINEVSKRSGKSTAWIRLVLKGEWPDAKVIKIAAKVLEERYKEETSIMNNVEELVTTCDVSKIRSLATV